MNQPTKKFGGTIKNWCLHTLCEGDSETYARWKEEYPDMMTDNGYLFTGEVVEDPLGRWQVGWKMKSSLVLNIDRENGIIETANTIYKVQDEGDGFTGGDIGPAAMGIYF